MKQLLTALLLLVTVSLTTSCESEYEERLAQGLTLRERLVMIEQSEYQLPGDQMSSEIEEITNEIYLLARVSGNEELFLRQVYAD